MSALAIYFFWKSAFGQTDCKFNNCSQASESKVRNCFAQKQNKSSKLDFSSKTSFLNRKYLQRDVLRTMQKYFAKSGKISFKVRESLSKIKKIDKETVFLETFLRLRRMEFCQDYRNFLGKISKMFCLRPKSKQVFQFSPRVEGFRKNASVDTLNAASTNS